MPRIGLLLLWALLLPACAGHDRIIVDEANTDMTHYEQDLAECRQYAEQVSVAGDAASGAVVGAVVGGLVGAAVGDSGAAQRGAGAGAVLGGAKGTGQGQREQDQVIKNCLRGRGYRILN